METYFGLSKASLDHLVLFRPLGCGLYIVKDFRGGLLDVFVSFFYIYFTLGYLASLVPMCLLSRFFLVI